MKVVMVGAGNVGRAVGEGLRRAGHEVRYAVRSPAQVDGGIPVDGSAQGADVVVLAVPFPVVDEVVPQLGLSGRTVLVDATNPFGRPLPEGVESGAEVVVRAAPGIRVVKAFNTLGAEVMAQPVFPDGRALMPVAGGDREARSLVAGLARDMGFDAVEVGGLDNAGLLEDAARYWGLLAYAGGLGRETGLAVLRREHG